MALRDGGRVTDVPIREGREASKRFWTSYGFHETDIRQFWAGM